MTINLELIRDTYSRDMGTFGKLSVLESPKPTYRLAYESGELAARAVGSVVEGPSEKLLELDTVERPWVNNAPNRSCIPEGTYRLAKRMYYRGGYETIEIQDVPDRTYIMIHKGNSAADVEGCIAVGRWRGTVLMDPSVWWAVEKSKEAFELLMKTIEGKSLGSICIKQYTPCHG